MDLNSILPLLMKGGGDRTQLLKTLMPQNEKAGELMGLMNLLGEQKKPHGLTPVREIAPNVYLGALLRYFSTPNRT